jgi:AI-2 transport protein TqsA
MDIRHTSASKQAAIFIIPAAIAIVVIIGIFLHFISDAFLTFVAALFLANIFVPIVERLRKKNVPMVFSILLVLAAVGAVLFGIVIVISTSVSSVSTVLPKYQLKWDHLYLPEIADLAGRISPNLKQQVMDFNFASLLPPARILAVLSSIPSLIGSFILILLFMLFILASHGQFIVKIEKAFPPSDSFHLKKMLQNIDSRVRTYLVTTLLINTLAGVAMTIVLLIFGVDLALLWGILTFLLMFIPSIGSIFAIALPLSVAFLQFDTIETPIVLSIIVIISQLMIGSYILPRVMGSTLNLSPLLILVSIIFWGWVWGPLGMILAVPITSAITIVFENIPPLVPLAMLMSSGQERKKRKIK